METVSTMEEYISLQVNEMLSPPFREKARLALGHDPNEDELALYYVESGAGDQFRETHVRRDE